MNKMLKKTKKLRISGKDIWTVIIVPAYHGDAPSCVSFNEFEDAVDYATSEIMHDGSNYDVAGDRLSEEEVKEMLREDLYFREDPSSVAYFIESSKLF